MNPRGTPKKIHIYAPLKEPPYSGPNWAEQILGTVVLPLYHKFEHSIRWLWVGRYTTKNENVPDRYHDENDSRRFVALRLAADNRAEKILDYALILIQNAGCYAPGWENLDLVEELDSKSRCIRSEATDKERVRRVQFVADFLNATTLLLLDSLVQNDKGEWCLESSSSTQNPHGSMFETIHHLFCNTTDVPTTVLLAGQQDDNIIWVGTHWMEPPFDRTGVTILEKRVIF